jgi:menaquinone-9 beta-reductase
VQSGSRDASDPNRHGGYRRPVTASVDCEVLVVGGGPSGVAAGITAGRLGLDALVIDKARFPRDKTCGDGLTAGALRALEALGFDVRTLPSYVRVREAVLVAPSGRRVALPLPIAGEHAGVVPRAELDDALVRHARTCGVDIREGVGIAGLRQADDTVVATLDDGTTISARWVIGADGHYSPVRRHLAADDAANNGTANNGADPDPDAAAPGSAELGTWHAFRQYFDRVDDPRLWVLFDADLLPGYAWVFPVGGGRANVGFGVLRERGQDAPSGKRLAAQWRTLLASPALRDVLGPHAAPAATHRAWPIPASFDGARLASGRVLFVGDAASVVDPMTGEGIAQALDTGVLAARAIARDATPRAVGARYRHDVERALGTDLWFAARLQTVLRSRTGAEAAIGVAALTPWTRRNFARWMFEDYPRAALLTPRRWRQGAFTRPGAYAG